MNNTVKKIVASITVLTCAVWMMGPGIAQALTVDELLALIAGADDLEDLQADIAAAQAAEEEEEAVTIEGVPADFTFETNLKLTDTGDDVKYLQIVLNSDSATQLAESGVGSAGEETSYFGPLTKAAVIKFQEKYTEDCLASWGLTEGTGFVGSTTRAKLNSLLAAAEEEEEEEEEVPPEGVLTVSLSADSPASGLIPGNAIGVEFMKFNLANGQEEEVIVDTILVKRVGMGNASDFDNVYLYEGDTRLTDGRSVRVSTNEVRFASLALEIPAGDTKTISVKADVIQPLSGATNAFQITSEDSIISDTEEIEGDFPITGSFQTISSAVDAGVIEIDDKNIDTSVNIGDEEVEIASFELDVNGEDALVQQITFTQNGSAGLDELANIVVERDGEEVGTVEISGDQLIITFEDETIEDGDREIYEIIADITASVNPDTDAIEMDIEENYDVYAIGGTYGYGMNVTNEYDVQTIEVKGGKMNLSYVGPSTGDIAAGDDITVFTFKVVNADELKVKETSFTFEGLSTTTYFDNFRLLNEETDIILGDTDTITTSNVVTFSDDYILDPGEIDLSVLVDIDEAIYANGSEEVFRVNLSAFGDSHVKDLDTGDYLVPADDIVPSDGLTGKYQTVIMAGLSVDTASTPEEQTYVAGTKAAELAGYTFEVVGEEGVIIDDLTLTATNTAGVDPDLIVSSVWLEDSSGNLIASAKNVDSDGTISFDNINWELEVSESATLIVVGDIRSDATSTTNTINLTEGSYETSETRETGTIGAANGQNMIIGVGALSVKIDASTPIPAIAVAGQEDVAFSIYEFEAVVEDYKLDKITVGGWVAGETDNLDTVYLSSDEGTVSKSSISSAAIEVTFTDLDWVVPANDKLEITVSADIKDLITDSNQSAESFDISMGTTTLYSTFRAIGEDSGNVLDNTEVTAAADLTAYEMTVYESKPYVEFVSLDDTVLANATKEIYKFTVDVDEAGDEIIMNQLRFALSGVTDATLTIDDAELYRKGVSIAIAEANETGEKIGEFETWGDGTAEWSTTAPTGYSGDYCVRMTDSTNAGHPGASNFWTNSTFRVPYGETLETLAGIGTDNMIFKLYYATGSAVPFGLLYLDTTGDGAIDVLMSAKTKTVNHGGPAPDAWRDAKMYSDEWSPVGYDDGTITTPVTVGGTAWEFQDGLEYDLSEWVAEDDDWKNAIVMYVGFGYCCSGNEVFVDDITINGDTLIGDTVTADGLLTFFYVNQEVSALTEYYISAAITGVDADEDLSTRFANADDAFIWYDGTVYTDANLLVIPANTATLSKD